MTCAALVLAAGRAQRFGSDKRLARLPSGQTLLAATLARAFEQFAVVHIVLRPGDDAQQLGIDPRARIVWADQAEHGQVALQCVAALTQGAGLGRAEAEQGLLHPLVQQDGIDLIGETALEPADQTAGLGALDSVAVEQEG